MSLQSLIKMKIKNAHIGTIALIQQQIDGSIKQIGLTQEQSDLLQVFLGAMSKESQFVLMPKEYDLTLQSNT